LRKQYLLLLLVCSLCFSESSAQIWRDGNFGGTLGLTFNMGTKVNRIGLQVNGFYIKKQIQLNTGFRLYYNYNSLGPKVKRAEAQVTTGILFAFGKQDTLVNNFLHAVSNQTGYKYSVAYARNFYFEKLTPQQTGTIGLNFGKVEFIHENDAFSFQGKDRFRTGGIVLSYRLPETRFAFNTTLWHGNTHGRNARRVKDAGAYPCRHGYKDLSATHCGRFSHGIMALQVQQMLPYAQTAHAGIGIDSEKIRHFWQNKVIHDLLLFPASWENAHNPHYPMLDENGAPYLFEEDQVLKPAAFFFDLGLNPTLFY